MSGTKQRKRPTPPYPRALPLFDPEAFTCWRLIEAVAPRMSRVVLISARAAPVDAALDGHVHALPTMVCCLRGTTRIETVGEAIDLHETEAAVVAPGAWHRHAPLRAGSAVYAQGLMARRSDVMLMHGPRRWWLTIHEQPSRRYLEQALSQDAQLRLLAVAALLGAFAREPALALTMSASQVAMARFLWGNFTRAISAGDILRASRRQRAQAHLSFRQCFGETPKQALTHARLSLAHHLEQEGFPANVIAQSSGFGTSARWHRTRRRWREPVAR